MTLYFSDITPYLSGDFRSKLRWFRILHDMNLPIGYSNLNNPINPPMGHVTSEEWDSFGLVGTLELKSGDIIGCGSFEYLDSDRQVKRTNACLYGKNLNPFGVSVDFFEKNSFIFEDVTLSINRNFKIDQII